MSTGINLQNIQIGLEAKDWKEAIRIASVPLVKFGSIEEPYVENMISSVETLGPYIVIMPQFALAHAAPCEYVKKSDISIATFKNDILNIQSKDDVLTYMIHLGYLGYDQTRKMAFVPNEDIRQELEIALDSKIMNK